LGPDPVIGVVYHWLGGLASATNFVPFRPIKRWSWEVYWIIQGFAAWILAPLLLAALLVPDLWNILLSAPSATFWHVFLWGALWGIGGLTFGLAIRYLGIALGYSIALGLCTAFGTLMPPLFAGQIVSILHRPGGRVILYGVGICLLAIAVNGLAGYFKDKEVTADEKAALGERDYAFARGLVVAVFAGIMSSCFAYGLAAGKPIASLARIRLGIGRRSEVWQNLPILVVVLWGGFLTNLIWSVILITRNRSWRQFLGAPGINPMGTMISTVQPLLKLDAVDPDPLSRLGTSTVIRNYALASSAGVIWYFQFFFYSIGQTKMGKYDFSSWTLHMASIIIFSTLWGISLREWKDTSLRTRCLVGSGLILLVFSTVVVGYGNFLEAR
jgi:L-rhamnose-H+ transport protein